MRQCARCWGENALKPHLRRIWCIPPKHSAEFVCHMEDVLDVYCRPLDPRRPVVCLDEMSTQLIAEVRTPLPVRPGQVARYDCEYVRQGTANLFMAFEPLGGWRELQVTERRQRGDWAHFVRGLVDGRYNDADRIVLVMDQLNTHSPASLYEAFAPAEAIAEGDPPAPSRSDPPEAIAAGDPPENGTSYPPSSAR